jgi:hypothetical protein
VSLLQLRFRGRAGAIPDPDPGGDYPLGVIGRTDEEAAWDTQTTSGLTNAGAVVAATTGNTGATEDAVGWYFSGGPFTIANKSFGKPVFVDGATVATFDNCSFACAASGSTGFDFFVLAINTNSGTTADVTLNDCYLDLTNVGLTRAAGIYHAGGTLDMNRCKAENAAANFITMFQSASACTIVDTYFKKFGCKAVAFPPPDEDDNTHCEPIHHRAGTLQVTKSFFDNRGGTNPAATTTSASVYTEASNVTIASTLDAVVVDGVTEAVGPYAVVLAEAGTGQATMTINGGAFELGSSGFIDKGTGTTLAGSNSLNLNTGALLTPSYG